jgi:glucose dehydrogenase
LEQVAVSFRRRRDHVLRALDSADGARLWDAKLENIPSATPISYLPDDPQYVRLRSAAAILMTRQFGH